MSDSRRALAQTKTSRQRRIVQLLTHEEVSSQSQLAQLLTAEGIEVTQATLSRDLVELQAEKVRGSAGSLVYRLPPEGGTARPVGAEGELLEARLGVAGNLQHWAVVGTAEQTPALLARQAQPAPLVAIASRELLAERQVVRKEMN